MMRLTVFGMLGAFVIGCCVFLPSASFAAISEEAADIAAFDSSREGTMLPSSTNPMARPVFGVAHTPSATLTRYLRPWQPRGFTIVGRLAPRKLLAEKSPVDHSLAPSFYLKAHDDFGPALVARAKAFGANILRMQVSQYSLDPKSKLYDPAYVKEVLAAIAMIREQHMPLIVSMQWEKGTRWGYTPEALGGGYMPNDVTSRAWAKLFPTIRNDSQIIVEIFNEPSKASPDAWKAAMERIVAEARRAGVNNLILAGGMGQILPVSSTEIRDPLNNTAYAMHPYFHAVGDTPAEWDKTFGDFAKTHAVLASEWFTKTCDVRDISDTQVMAHYLNNHNMGLIMWFLDGKGPLLDGQGRPTSFTPPTCPDGNKDLFGQGQMISDIFHRPTARNHRIDMASSTTPTSVTIDILNEIKNPASVAITSLRIVRAPRHGTATVRSDKRVIYKPLDSRFKDSFMYEIEDANRFKERGVVYIVLPHAARLQAHDDTAEALIGDRPLILDVLANDEVPFGEQATLTRIATKPRLGEARILPTDAGIIRYVPPVSQTLISQTFVSRTYVSDTFIYEIKGTKNDTSSATVTVNLSKNTIGIFAEP